MQYRYGTRVRIGNALLSNENDYMSRDARHRRTIAIVRLFDIRMCPSELYAYVSGKALRSALDAITLDDAQEVIVPVRSDSGEHHGTVCLYADEGIGLKLRIKSSPARPDQVRIQAPCGMWFRFKIRTLDRALTRLGA